MAICLPVALCNIPRTTLTTQLIVKDCAAVGLRTFPGKFQQRVGGWSSRIPLRAGGIERQALSGLEYRTPDQVQAHQGEDHQQKPPETVFRKTVPKPFTDCETRKRGDKQHY